MTKKDGVIVILFGHRHRFVDVNKTMADRVARQLTGSFRLGNDDIVEVTPFGFPAFALL